MSEWDANEFDYLFAMDYVGISKYCKEFAAQDCIKFIGDAGAGRDMQISEAVVEGLGSEVRRYRSDSGHLDSSCSRFAVDIESQALGNFHTVAMQAMQFALYCHPRRIYLVGIDCSTGGHFDATGKVNEEGYYAYGRSVWANSACEDWLKLKDFADAYYPDVKIISVNPVGLRGLFEDIDQE